MDLALKMPWVGMLVFFCVATVPSESGDSCTSIMLLKPQTVLRMVQVTVTKGNILADLILKAMKNKDNKKMIKGIKGLTVNELKIPDIEIIFSPPDIIKIKLELVISVAGKSFIGGNMVITVGVQIMMAAKISRLPNGELLFKVTDCKVVVKSCKTNLPSSMLPKIVNKFLDSTLAKVMPGVLCPATDMIMEKIKASFKTILGKKPIWNIGFIQLKVSEKPVVVSTHISINLKIIVEKKNGEVIPFECDPLPDNLPAKEGKTVAFYLPASALHALMILYQPHLNTPLTKVKGSVPTSDHLKKMLPGAGLPAGKKLKIQVTHREHPLIAVSSTGVSITTRTEVSFMDVKRGNTLISFQMEHECSASIVIKREMMIFSLTAGSCRTREISSSAGDASAASKYLETVMEDAIPHMNNFLNKAQVPLLSLTNATNTADDIELVFEDNLLIMYKEVEAYTSEEMEEEVKKQCKAIKL
ncbi:BPI fold-containing family B member 6-like [Vipera latastei]